MPARSEIHRVALCSMGIGFCIFVLISLLSFQVQDWPNPDVYSSAQTQNLCGRVGAIIAYYGQYYLGPATLLIALATIALLICRCMHKPVDQPILRGIGVLLIAATWSSAYYLLNSGDTHSLSIGNGGILGVAVGHFLLTNTATLGAIVILTAGFIVGMLLAADNLVVLLPKIVPMILKRFRIAWADVAAVRVETRPHPKMEAKPKRPKFGLFRRITTLLARKKEGQIPDAFQDSAQLAATEAPMAADTQREENETVATEDEEIPVTTDSKEAKAQRDTSLKQVSSALAKLRGFAKPTSNTLDVNAGDYSDYKYPSLDLLEEPQRSYAMLQEKVVREKGRVLSKTLQEFNINANVVEAETGPVITMYELELAPGIKVAQITSLSNDLARSLGAQSVRVVAPLPGRHTIGIEVPNNEKEKVRIKELMQLGGSKPSKMQIPLFLGKDASGEALISDLTEMPHCLIAGTTGSGKSVCINSIIMSILLTQRPDMVKMILIDPKMVEMTSFRDLAHLMCPIVNETKKSEQILEWLCTKMDERYAILAEARVRNIVNYNKLTEEEIYERFLPDSEEEKAKVPLKLPYIVVIIDELADLMMTSAKEVESYIIRLAQKSRAVGIHIILATQRPQATVVTGLIKSNLPTRISFRVAARMDSRIVLDQNGAETLLGQGDMLFLKPGTSDLMRAQGTFISDKEINHTVKFLKEIAQPSYHPELVQMNTLADDTGERDELFDDAVRIILESRRGSVSLLQRRLTIGYSRASRLVDQMAAAGIVGDYKGSQAREVLLTLEEYEHIRRQMEKDAVMGYNDMADAEECNGAVVIPEDQSSGTAMMDPVETTAPEPSSVETDDIAEEEEEEEEEDETLEEDDETIDDKEAVDDHELEEEGADDDEEWEYVEVEVEEEDEDADDEEEEIEEEVESDTVRS